MKFAPTISWDRQVHTYLEHAFGAPKLQRISEGLCRPSLRTCLRVNTLTTSPQAVVQQLQQLFPSVQPHTHPSVTSAVIVPGKGPLQPAYELCEGREVVINRLAGEAVLKGAQVFSPGLLAATKGLAEGDMVAVSVALEQQGGGWCGVNRGMILTKELKQQLAARQQQLFVGVGRVTAGRVGLFRQQEGLAVDMQQRVFEIPPCNGVLRGQVMLQALPCIVAAQALDPAPGSRVLDMCAAPGGKTSMLAQIMGNAGTIIALDRTQAKVQQVQDLAADWGVTCIQAMVADATQLYQQERQQTAKRPRQDERLQQELPQESQQPLQQQQRQVQQQQQQQQQQLVQQQQEHQDVSSSQVSSSCAASTVAGHSAVESATGSSDSHSTTLLEQTSNQASSSSSNSSSNSGTKNRSKRRPSATATAGLSPEVAAAVQPASFDYVLLDAPCSALGLRPRLLVDWKLPALQKLAAYQRALLTSAVHVLKPGGHLVYCTCTINPGENEENVRYVLDKWPQMQLVGQPVVIGGPGLVGQLWLTAAEAQLVQRFDPIPDGEEDTIGFFIAKFVKTGPA